MDWNVLINEFIAELGAAGQPETTQGLRGYHLRRLASDMTAKGLTPDTVERHDLVAWLTEHEWKRETMRSHRASVRRFFGWLHGQGWLSVDPAFSLPSIKPQAPQPRPVAEDDYAFALVVADARERLMLRLAAEAGLRRGEVCKVHKRDLVRDLDGWSLHVNGKGGKPRLVPLKADLARAVQAWEEPGYLFPGRMDGHLSPAYVGKRIAALLPPGYSMHKLRTRFATRAYHATRDIYAVQQLLGHSSPTTTQAYVPAPMDAARAAVEAI